MQVLFRAQSLADMASSHKSHQLPRLTFKRTLGWVGSARAFGWPAITLVAFWPLLIGSFGETPPGYELPINIHLFDLLNGLAPALVLVIFRVILRVNQPTSFKGSTLINLGAWLLAAVLGVLLPLGLVSLVGSVPSPYWEAIPIGVLSEIGQIIGYSTVAIVVGELRRSAKQLAQKQHALKVTQAGLEQQILEQRSSLNAEVEGRLAGQIAEIQNQLSQLKSKTNGTSAQGMAEKIGQTIDGVVRPLSLEIAATDSSINRTQIRSIRELERTIKRLPFTERMKFNLPLGHVLNLTFASFYLAVFVLPSYGFVFGAVGVLEVALPASAIAVALIVLARRLVRGIESSYLLALVEILIAAGFASLPYALLGDLFLSEADQGLGIYLALEAFIVFAVTFYASLFAEASFLILDRAKVANNDLRKLVGFLQNEAQINRRTMAQVVHGKVQARLQAASIRLKQADEITDDLLADIATDLNATILDTADTSLDRASVDEQLTEMSDQWAGICDLTFTLNSGVAEAVDSNPVAKAAVVEVIREAINNAVKHGDADEVDAVVSMISPDELELTIRNAVYSDSANDHGAHPRGYGSQLLDQITDSWSVRFEENDAIFEAKISVGGTNL